MMECLGLLFISGAKVFLTLSGSTGLTAILALLPGLVAADLVPLVWGEAAALRDARLLREDVLRCNILSFYSVAFTCIILSASEKIKGDVRIEIVFNSYNSLTFYQIEY